MAKLQISNKILKNMNKFIEVRTYYSKQRDISSRDSSLTLTRAKVDRMNFSSPIPCMLLQILIFISSKRAFMATSALLLCLFNMILESSLNFSCFCPFTSPFSHLKNGHQSVYEPKLHDLSTLQLKSIWNISYSQLITTSWNTSSKIFQIMTKNIVMTDRQKV